MERKIVVYGHGDKRPGLGFPTDRDFEQWIKEDIFTKNRGRYHYTIGKDADVMTDAQVAQRMIDDAAGGAR